MGILNYTTKIAPSKTAHEMSVILGKHGANEILHIFELGEVVGLQFALPTPNGPRYFKLPINAEGVHRALNADRTVPRANSTPEQALRTAWRIAKDWLAAQLAIVDAEMATVDEVMFPYMITPTGKTMYQLYEVSEQAAIEAAGRTDR